MNGQSQPQGNRQQRRAAQHRRYRGVGFTRQYASKRAREQYGREQKSVRAIQARLFKQWMEQMAAMPMESAEDPVVDSEVDSETVTDPVVNPIQASFKDEVVVTNGEITYLDPNVVLDPEEDSGSFRVETETPNGEWSNWSAASEKDLTDRISASNVKEAVALVNSGNCDKCLEAVRSAEVNGRNRSTVLRALDARSK